MELRQIEAFVSIATLRNFRAAANRLHITQPAVSLRLAALEEELGAKLLDRSGNEVTLTARGMQLLQTAEQLLATADMLKTQAAGAPAARQIIRIGTTSTIVSAWLPRLFAEVKQDLPQHTLEMNIDTSPRLRALLLEGELDLAIIMGPTHAAGVRNVSLASYHTEWIASPRLRLPAKMSFKDLAAYPIITYARDSATYGSVEEAFRVRGLWPIQLNSVNSSEALVCIAESGLAIGAVSAACLLGELDGRRLQVIQTDVRLPAYEFFASYHMDSVGRVGMMVAEIALRVSRESQAVGKGRRSRR